VEGFRHPVSYHVAPGSSHKAPAVSFQELQNTGKDPKHLEKSRYRCAIPSRSTNQRLTASTIARARARDLLRCCPWETRYREPLGPPKQIPRPDNNAIRRISSNLSSASSHRQRSLKLQNVPIAWQVDLASKDTCRTLRKSND